MLKELSIDNIILIESTKISFERGLHIFSGETGAGKTAIMHALRLLLGAKADTQLVRNGAEKASVSALFEFQDSAIISSILIAGGINVDTQDSLLIKREILNEIEYTSTS